jgi:hypothetical protein
VRHTRDHARLTKVLAQNWHWTVGSVPDENRNNEVASRRDGGIIAAVFEAKKRRIPEYMADSVYMVIELVGTSLESCEKAAAAAVSWASNTLRDRRV